MKQGSQAFQVNQVLRDFNLQTKLMMAFLSVSTVSVGSVAFFSIRTISEKLTQQVGQDLKRLATAQAVITGDMLARQVDALQSLSVNRTLRVRIIAHQASFTGDLDETRRQLKEKERIWMKADDTDFIVQNTLKNTIAEELSVFQEKFPDHTEVFVTGIYGELFAATNRIRHFYMADEAWWQAAYNAGQGAIYIGTPILAEDSATFSLPIALPVFDTNQTTVQGVLRTTYRLTTLSDAIASTQSEQQDIHINLLFPDRTMLSQDNNRLISIKPHTHAVLQNLETIPYGDFSFLGVRSLVSRSPVSAISGETLIDELGWAVVIHQNKKNALAPVKAQQRAMLFLSMLVSGVAAVIAIVIGQSLAQPIVNLTAIAKRVSKGDLSVRAPVDSQDETGQLAAAFNSMTAQLTESIETLEERVALRTVELSEAKEDADLANQAKSIFLANMSHELRTPLNTILGFSRIVLRDSAISPETKENLSIISRSGDHLLSLINQVLDLSKIEAGRMTLNEDSCDLYLLMDILQDLFQLRAQEKGLQLLFTCAPEVPQYVYTDEVKLRQILINLINNALKFTVQGSVTLHIDQLPGIVDKKRLSFAVTDTGLGVPREEAEKLFEAFTQVKGNASHQEGTGLGLAISKSFVQLMGGDIRMESEVGQGTTVTFDILTRAVERSAVTGPTIDHRQIMTLAPGQPTYRILVVDDHWSARQLLIKLLAPLGFELQEAENGQQAIEVWDRWNPHLIWMDMRMPVMDGYAATRHIKAAPNGKATVIIALTASAFEDARDTILDAGCDDFLRKPFRDTDIFAALHNYLGVQYVYEDREPAATVVAPGVQAAFMPQVLAELPLELLAKLEQAAIRLEANTVQQIIDEVRSHNILVADRLASLADDFRYEDIVSSIQATKELE